jgi:hypothetical protein
MKSVSKKPEKISAAMLGDAVSLGVARAVAARAAACVELSDAEVSAVSGGIILPPPILIRGYPPVVNVAALAATAVAVE